MDTSKQMSHVVDLFAKIPQHINVFIIPGNQKSVAHNLCCRENILTNCILLENFTMLGNPSLVELDGVKILMYHGQSWIIIATTPGLSYSKPGQKQ